MWFPSEEYLNILKEFEGFYAKPYLCPAGKCTIGYGTNLEAHRQFIPYENIRNSKLTGEALRRELINLSMHWTQTDAENAMYEELIPAIKQLADKCHTFCKLIVLGEYTRAECLVDMAYNMGVAGLLSFKNTLQLIHEGNYSNAASAMENSKWYKQVGRRSRTVVYTMRNNLWSIQK